MKRLLAMLALLAGGLMNEAVRPFQCDLTRPAALLRRRAR